MTTSVAARRIPEIANVYPDFVTLVNVPRIITGEGFDVEGLQLRSWEVPSDPEAVVKAAYRLGRGPGQELPAEPPPDAATVEPLDVEPQVIAAHLPGTVLWVGGPDGWSKPCLLKIPKPFWISRPSARPGQLLHMFGRSLRPERKGMGNFDKRAKPEAHIVLCNGTHTIFAPQELEGRSTQWIADSRLVYFRVPGDTPAGQYQLFVHNGSGGVYGWAAAGSLEIVTDPEPLPQLLDAREFGARGDGLADDLPALRSALSAAARTGATVFLPPGTYRVDGTLSLPAGVTLRGAGRENTILRGSGHRPGGPLAAVVALTDRTGLSELTVCGACGSGVLCERHERSDMSTDAMIRLEPAQAGQEVADVSILSCRIRALEEDPATRETLYLKAIHVGKDCFGQCRHFTLNNNEIHGSLFFWRGRRLEIVRNKWLDSTATIIVSIHGWATDSLLDSNLFTDTPGRLCFYPIRHCLLRSNEIHGAFKGTWTNAEEVYLLHGSYENYFHEEYTRVVGQASDGEADSLTDARQNWKTDEHLDSVLLITAGRGFGQYRTVVGNSSRSLRVDSPWRVQPDATTRYVVGRMYLENDLFANLNDTPLRMSLWLDCIANVVDRHRDEFSKGIDIWGADGSARKEDGSVQGSEQFHPSWYNMILSGWMDGAMAHLYSSAGSRSVHTCLPMFANFVAGNRIRQPHMQRTGFESMVPAVGGVIVGSAGEKAGRHSDRVTQSHAVICGNQISFTTAGITLLRHVRKTLVLGNYFQQVAHPVLDWSDGAVIQKNRVMEFDQSGWRTGDLVLPDKTPYTEPPPRQSR